MPDLVLTFYWPWAWLMVWDAWMHRSAFWGHIIFQSAQRTFICSWMPLSSVMAMYKISRLPVAVLSGDVEISRGERMYVHSFQETVDPFTADIRSMLVHMLATVRYSRNWCTTQMVEKQASGRAWVKLSTFNGRNCKTSSQRALPRVQAAGSRLLPGAQPPPPPYLRKENDLSERRSFLSPVETSLPVQSLSQ